MDIDEEIAKIILSPATSYWLRNALELALVRDSVDACNDAELLSSLLNQKFASDNVPVNGAHEGRLK